MDDENHILNPDPNPADNDGADAGNDDAPDSGDAAADDADDSPPAKPAKEKGAPPADDAVASIIARAFEQNNHKETRAAAEAQERERLALMTPEERKDYENDKRFRALQQEITGSRIQQANQLDKMRYDTRAESNPMRKKLADGVEKIIAERHARGDFVDRDTAYYYLLGKEMDGKLGKQAGKQRDKAQENLRNASTGATSARGDTPRNGKQPQTARERLMANGGRLTMN